MECVVGIRELKTNLSTFLRRVRDGETIVITHHGKPIGRIVPVERTLEERLEAMVASGAASWDGRHLPAEPPEKLPAPRGDRTVAEDLWQETLMRMAKG